MPSRKSFVSLLLALSASASLSGCGERSMWQEKYAAGQQALKQNNIPEAESQFKAAIADADKHRIPEPQYAPAVIQLGELLYNQGKYAEAQPHLIHAVSLATATKMPTDRNIALLKLLESSFEKAHDYEHALDTQDVLLNYVATEKSPLANDYVEGAEVKKRLEVQIAAAPQQKKEACCENEGKTE